jgi:hypothetical protein
MGRPFFAYARRIQGRWWTVFAGDLVVSGLWFWLADDGGGGDLVNAVALVGGVLALVSAVVFFVIGYTEARRSDVRTGSRGTG